MSLVGEPTERQRLLAFRVDGKARPKGSLKPRIVRTRQGKLKVVMEEQVTDGPLWRRHVALGARKAISSLGGFAGEGGVTGFPTVLPVRVRCWFGFERIAGSTVEGAEYAPVSSYFGDWDKLLRNVLDALTDAGVYRDDKQVIGPIGDCGKYYVAPGEAAHTLIEVWEDF